MNILYRRWAGSLALSDNEQGLRGIWWEKRRALLAYLRRQHTVTLASKPSRFSRGLYPWPAQPKGKADLLMLEFGPCHWVWNQDDIQDTAKLIQTHKGRIVFLCDDPEMLYGCLEPRALRLLNQKSYSRWTLWLNSPNAANLIRPQLAGAKAVDAPFAALIKPRSLSKPVEKAAVYMGRGSDGREAILSDVAGAIPLHVYGEPRHWEKIVPQGPPPTQVSRGDVYARYVMSVCVADQAHKTLPWRTGRAYHALLAGVPVVVEQDHAALANTFAYFRNPEDIKEAFKTWSSPERRKVAWVKQTKAALGEHHFEEAEESLCA